MSFQSAPDCAEAVIQATFGGVNIANVLNFKNFAGYDQPDIDALAAIVDAGVGGDYLGILSSSVAYTGTLVRGLESSIDMTAVDNTSAGAGALTGPAVAANVSLVATLRTGFTGRSARGRFFMMPTAADQLASVNTFGSGFSANLVTFLTNLQAEAALSGWTMIVLSRFSGGVPRGTAIATPVTDIELRNLTVDSQRHRLPRGH